MDKELDTVPAEPYIVVDMDKVDIAGMDNMAYNYFCLYYLLCIQMETQLQLQRAMAAINHDYPHCDNSSVDNIASYTSLLYYMKIKKNCELRKELWHVIIIVLAVM